MSVDCWGANEVWAADWLIVKNLGGRLVNREKFGRRQGVKGEAAKIP
jgi:hypothetical protein